MTGKEFTPAITIGPRVRKSPYFDATVRHGVKAFTVYNHMFMPTAYSDPVTEYWQLVNDVTIWDVACERQVEIIGPDALQFVQLLTPRNLSNLSPNQCLYVVLTAEDGGIINDAVLLRLAKNHFWFSPGDGDVLLWAQGVAVKSGLDVTVSEPDVSPLQLQGPKSPQVAEILFGDLAYELGYYRMCQTELDGIPLVLSRTGWSGELGYELFLRDGSRGDELWEKVMDAGSDYDITPIAPSTIRSIEGAIFSYVSDITRNDNPFTVGLDRLVDLDQEADFLGKEALKKIKSEGIQRRLVGVEIDGKPLAQANDAYWPVWNDQQVIGRVSRCVFSPRLEKNIGFVNVPIEHADPGSKVRIQTSVGMVDAIVVSTPFIPPEKKIPAP